MKRISILLTLSAFFLVACGSGGTADVTETTTEVAEPDVVEEVVEVETSDEMMEDFQDSRDMWEEVIEEGVDADMDMAILKMKASYGLAYFHVFNGEAPAEIEDFMADLYDLNAAAEAGEFEMDFYVEALAEGLVEYDALLADM
jgi:hypothetical protein